MAYVAANGQDPNEQQATNSGAGGTITSGGAQGASGGGSSAYQAPAASRGNPSGTPNVSQYLNANPNAGQQLASGITQNVQNQANKLNQNYQTSQDQLGNLYNPLNTSVSQGQNTANAAFQDPQALLSAYQNQQTGQAYNANDYNNYNNLQSNIAGTQQYNAQQSQLQGAQTAATNANQNFQSQLGSLGQTAGLAANQLGQNQLLSQSVATPNYSSAQQALDTLFLQSKAPQLQQNLNNIYNTTSQNLTQPGNDYTAKLNALQGLSNQNATGTANLFQNGNWAGTPGAASATGGLNQIGLDTVNNYANLGTQSTADQTAMQQAATNNNFSQDQLNQLGLTAGTQTYGLSPTQILQAQYGQDLNPAAVQAYNAGGSAQAASGDEFARYNALNSIAGGVSGAGQNSIFGTATTAGYTPYAALNQDQLQTQLGAAQQGLSSDYNTALQQTEQAMNSNKNINNSSWINQLQNAKNPGQAEQDIQSYLNNLNSEGVNNNTGEFSMTNPFQQYYNSEYLPGVTSTINGQSYSPGYTPYTNATNTPTGNGLAGGPGAPVSPEQQAAWQKLINNTALPNV